MAAKMAWFLAFLLVSSLIPTSNALRGLDMVPYRPSGSLSYGASGLFQQIALDFAPCAALKVSQGQYHQIASCASRPVRTYAGSHQPAGMSAEYDLAQMSIDAFNYYTTAKNAIINNLPEALTILETSLGWLKANAGTMAKTAKDQLIIAAMNHPVAATVIVAGTAAYLIPWGPLVEWTWDRVGPAFVAAIPSTPITPGPGTYAAGSLDNNALTSYTPRFTGNVPAKPNSYSVPRDCILDAANIAYRGGGGTFDGQAVVDVAKILQDRHFPVKMVLPEEMKNAIMNFKPFRKQVKNLDILEKWIKKNPKNVVWAQNDDKTILQTAANEDAFVISDDRYSDWHDGIREGTVKFQNTPSVLEVIEHHVLKFSFKGGLFKLIGDEIPSLIYREARNKARNIM